MVTICTIRFNNTKTVCILRTECIYVLGMVPTINSDNFPKQHSLVGLRSGDIMCFLSGAN
jgi:hypothetical protein